MLYFLIITIGCLIIITLNTFLNPMGLMFYEYAIISAVCVASSIAIVGINGIIVKSLPKKWFENYKSAFFFPNSKELKFYKKIKVNKWKELVPEWGAAGGFKKDKIYKPNDLEYLRKYIEEICYGIVLHYCSFFTSYLSVLCAYYVAKIMYGDAGNLILTLALPMGVIGSVLWLLPAFVLKYNLPKISRLYEAKSKGLF